MQIVKFPSTALDDSKTFSMRNEEIGSALFDDTDRVHVVPRVSWVVVEVDVGTLRRTARVAGKTSLGPAIRLWITWLAHS